MFSLETENQQNCCYTGGKGQGPTLLCSPHLCPLSLGHTARPACSQVWPREHMTKPWIRDTWCPSPGALSYAMLIPFSAARKLWTETPWGWESLKVKGACVPESLWARPPLKHQRSTFSQGQETKFHRGRPTRSGVPPLQQLVSPQPVTTSTNGGCHLTQDATEYKSVWFILKFSDNYQYCKFGNEDGKDHDMTMLIWITRVSLTIFKYLWNVSRSS